MRSPIIRKDTDMIRVISDIPVMDDTAGILHIQELAGNSDETKPTDGLANGSMFLETDTGLIALYDEDDGWGEAQ